MNYPVIDGFSFNTKLRPNLTFLNMVLRERFDSLRRAAAYRSKWWCVPKDASSFSIPATDAFEEQVYITPGGVIWGWIFVVNEEAEGSQFSIQVTDGCTDVPLFSEVVNLGTNQGGSLMPGQGKQNLLPKLCVIGQPGTVNVQICSLDNSSVNNTQLILCGAEPVPEDQCDFQN